jgi:hemerythrin
MLIQGEIFMALEWREQLSVGNDLIDEDHKHLIGLINRAEQDVQSQNMQGVTGVLADLANYAKIHFAREELIAAAAGFPDVDRMHTSHDSLVAHFQQVRQELGETFTQAAGEHFIAFLRDWLISHVIKEDLRMKPFLIKHSPRFDPRK